MRTQVRITNRFYDSNGLDMILSVTIGGREWELKTWLGILADRTHRHKTNRNNIMLGRSIALG